LAQVNARGLIVFKTEDYGHVCCIPLGMSEVSSIKFDKKMFKEGATVTKGQEMGMFNYGGSSFAIIYEKLPGKELVFENVAGTPYLQKPVVPKGSSGTGGDVTLIGSKIGVWKPVDVYISVEVNDDDALIYATGGENQIAFLAQIRVTVTMNTGEERTVFVDKFEVGGNMVSPGLTQLKARVPLGKSSQVKSCSAQAEYWLANQVAKSS
jgi:hypothetical protein